jgi:hypothetical protein
MKHAPGISKSCPTPHGPVDGDTDNTTGALTPSATAHVVVRVNAPKKLLSPAVNVVVTVTIPVPPQHANGNAVPGNPAIVGNVPLTRLQLVGVTAVTAVTDSGTESPFVSHANVAAVDTVLPGLCTGTPVLLTTFWQISVTSFGKKPHPIRFSCTAHSAFTNPVVVGVVTNGLGTTN